MQSHLDTLGWLHLLAGWVGVITGVSLIVLTLGAGSLLGDPATAGRVAAVMWLLGGAGLLLVTGGFVMMATRGTLGSPGPGTPEPVWSAVRYGARRIHPLGSAE
jgi:amino acid transporter